MASVFIGDLDDIIGPSQSCVNPIFAGESTSSSSQQQQNGGPAEAAADRGKAKLTLEATWMEADDTSTTIRPDLIKTKGPGSAATVSLNDCLACSGCVTSAETVLISQQSGEEFLRVLSGSSRAHTRAVVLALSPQALASLAVHLGSNSERVQQGLSLFFKALARRATALHRDPLPVYVYNITAAAPIALAEATAEFIARYRYTHHHQQQQQHQQQHQHSLAPAAAAPIWQAPAPSRALSSTRDAAPITSTTTALEAATGYPPLPPSLAHTRLPMLASECPGWVCYAEKTTPQALPYLSTAKSPQQVLGTLVKSVLAPREGLKEGEVCLVGVMPCYDKKLEASRRDFVHEAWGEGGGEGGVPEVDLVLTAGEVLEMLRGYGEQQQQQQMVEGASMNEHDDGDDAGLAVVRALFFSFSGSEEEGEGGEDAMEVEENSGSSSSNSKGLITARAAVAAAAGPTARPLTLQSAEERLFKGGSLLPYSSSSSSSSSSGMSEIGSGGYLEHIFRGAARALFGVEVGPGPLQYQQGRNGDYKEVVLEVGGEEMLRFALAYGFRNIQGVMGKMRRGKCSVQFVEIMACPSGCVNGGGMVKGGQGEASAVGKERVGRVMGRLWEDQVRRRKEEEEVEEEEGGREGGALARWAYGEEVAREGVGGETALSLFHTRYHAVPKLEQANPSVIKW